MHREAKKEKVKRKQKRQSGSKKGKARTVQQQSLESSGRADGSEAAG